MNEGSNDVPRDLAIAYQRINCDGLLDERRWLVPPNHVPLMIGALGDWIFRAPDASRWSLCLLEGDYRKIANSSEEFCQLKEDPENLESWFKCSWVVTTETARLVPGVEEMLGLERANFSRRRVQRGQYRRVLASGLSVDPGELHRSVGIRSLMDLRPRSSEQRICAEASAVPRALRGSSTVSHVYLIIIHSHKFLSSRGWRKSLFQKKPAKQPKIPDGISLRSAARFL
jgi:hypothetical protein